jgi:hypothetical protein
MAKKLIPGKEKSKGKKYSHRPKRFEDQWYCKETRTWLRGTDPDVS